jgi:hypothetical protein
MWPPLEVVTADGETVTAVSLVGARIRSRQLRPSSTLRCGSVPGSSPPAPPSTRSPTRWSSRLSTRPLHGIHHRVLTFQLAARFFARFLLGAQA